MTGFTVYTLISLFLCSIAIANQPEAHTNPVSQQNSHLETADQSNTDDMQRSPTTIYTLPEYETIVTKRRTISKDHTKNEIVVSGETLRNSPQPSTLEAISQEDAGIYVTGRGSLHGVSNGATGGIYIRGLGGSPNSQILVLEDGVPDYQGIFGHPIPDAYIPFLIDDLLVIKGGDSVLYGTNAMGGVILIRSRWLEKDGFQIFNDSAYGSFSTMKEAVTLLVKHKQLDVAGSFFGFTTDGHRDGAGGNESIGQLGVRYHFSPHLKLIARNKIIHLTGADPGPVTHPNPEHWYDVWRNNSSLQLQWRHQSMRLTITPHFNLGIHRLYDGFYSRDYVAGTNAEFSAKLHKSLDVIIGVSCHHVNGEVENRVDPEIAEVQGLTDVSFYNQATLRPLQNLSIVLGTRELYSLTYGFIFLYKGGMKWNFYNNFFIKSAYTKNYRQPTIRELYLPFPSANPDLLPEYAKNVDIQTGYDSDKLHISITGYRTHADNMIKYFGSWPTAEVVNIDHITILGLEGALSINHLGPFYGSFSADFRDVGRYTRQNPSLKVSGTFGMRYDFGQHFFEGSLCGQWVHGLYMANYKRDPIDDAVSVDASLRYRYTLSDRHIVIEPYLFLRNILNTTYAFVEHYPMPGFNTIAGLRIEL